ncbi:MAG TPA: hypothetical protein O0X09_03390 [Methanocorpusculum sp.]|nr:hypothetical protein [Methanocorpusculum sp.]
MKKILAVLLVIFCVAGGLTGFALATEADTPDLAPPLSAPVTEDSDFNYGIPSEMKVYHPLSMIFFETDVKPLEVFSSLIWLPAEMTDGNPGLYYEKTLIINVIPESVSYFSAF